MALTRRQLQMHANAMAVLRHRGLVGTAIAEDARLEELREDRLFLRCSADAETQIDACPAFRRRLVIGHGRTARCGWREEIGSPSMQLILHAGGLLEVDFDLANPGFDLWRLIRHGLEVLGNRIRRTKTDPLEIRAGLQRRGIEVPEVSAC